MIVLDVADRANPKLIVHRNWSPPFGDGTHNCLPLPDRDLLVVLDEAVLDHQEDGLKLIWVFDNRTKANPVSISTFPTPAEADYLRKGGHFGPHNIHENRPGSFVSSELIFATYQNARVRASDIRDPFRPRDGAALHRGGLGNLLVAVARLACGNNVPDGPRRILVLGFDLGRDAEPLDDRHEVDA